jgi:hypothetical protein
MTTTKKIKATQQMEMTALANQIETANTQSTPSFARGRGLLAVLATMTVLATLFLIATTPRWRANAPLESATRDQRPTVSVVSPQRANANAVCFTHAGFDSGSLATTVHRELFEQTVRLPSRETEVGQRRPHRLRRHIDKRDRAADGRR